MAVPDDRLTNLDLERRLDTNDQWIVERTGIRERRVAGPSETTSTLASAAGLAAIKDAGLTPDDIGLLVVATMTADQAMPGASALVADSIGLSCGAFDLGAACAGFAYGLIVGSSVLAAGQPGQSALVVGVDTMTRIVDPADRNTAILFGDGAGAVVLTGESPSKTGDAHGVLGWDFGTDGSGSSLLEVPAGERWLRMDGREVFRRAVRVLTESSLAALAQAGLTPDQVDLFVPHQANIRIIDATASRLGFDQGDRMFVNVDRYGNTSAGSIPIALAEAAELGRLRDGDIVLLSGIGAGLTWASAVVRWGRGRRP
jgi:3-oxoacyl-[acyl-carrier-protein] synthase-3